MRFFAVAMFSTHLEKQDHPLSQVRSLAIDTAYDFIAQIGRSELRLMGSDLRFQFVWELRAVSGTFEAV